MDEQVKFDGRDMRLQNWSWVGDDLYRVFAPIIGPLACWLYHVMCYLIPSKQRNPMFDLTYKAIARASGFGPSTISREMNVLIKIGMVTRSEGLDGTYEYHLQELTTLAALGTVELKRRLEDVPQRKGRKLAKAVPVGNDEEQEGGLEAPAGASADSDESGSGSGLQGLDRESDPETEAAAPAACGDEAVPVGNDDAEFAGDEEKTLADLVLFQKRGGLVPQGKREGAKTGGSCSSGERLIKEELKPDNYSPLPPASGGSGGLSIAASAEDGNGDGDGKGQSKNLPDEIHGEVAALRAAVTKVLRECSLSGRRHDELVDRQLRSVASATDGERDYNAIAEAMCAAREEYSRLGRNGQLRIQFGIVKFFGEGIWRDHGLWGIDVERVRQQRQAGHGARY